MNFEFSEYSEYRNSTCFTIKERAIYHPRFQEELITFLKFILNGFNPHFKLSGNPSDLLESSVDSL